jgi:hypothetical protein
MLDATRRATVLQIEKLKMRFFSEARIALRGGFVS